jgi:hypothetical protein
LISDENLTNDARAAAVEKYILQQAVEAKVVKEIKISRPRNPNKWGKSLAPWYTDACRKARQDLAAAKRDFGKGDIRVVQATRAFH